MSQSSSARRAIQRANGTLPPAKPKGPAFTARPRGPLYAAFFREAPLWVRWFLLPTAKKRAVEAAYNAEVEKSAQEREAVTP